MTLAVLALAAQVTLAPCPIEGVPGEPRCGTYRVWENRETRQGRQIDLAIIVLPASGPKRRPDPFFMLSGGPGDAPSFNARFFSRAFHEARRSRDLVLVDLRGTGRSGALTCPELATPDASGIFDPDLLSVPAVKACRARRHPSSLRAVAIKGIVPPSMASPESHARAGEAAWTNLVSRCMNDPNCARTFPAVDADFRQLLARLDKAPVLTLPASSSRPAASVRVTRGLFAEAFRNLLYTPEASAQAPKLVRQLLQGDERSMVETALAGRTVLGGDRLAAGFFLSVSCTEDVPFLPKDTSSLAAGTFGGDYRLQQQIAACAEWPRGKVPATHRQPTRSAVPTLILSGELDPVTPPAGGDEVARGLLKGVHVVIRNNGHPIGNAEACIGQLIGAFLDRGSAAGLDRTCVAANPAPPFLLSGPGK